VWNNLGSLSEIEGDLPGATAAYREAVRLDPGTPRFLANLASVLAAQGQHDGARALLERAVALDPAGAQWHEALQALQAGGNRR
jgi:Flp pilus assembly protein TadD